MTKPIIYLTHDPNIELSKKFRTWVEGRADQCDFGEGKHVLKPGVDANSLHDAIVRHGYNPGHFKMEAGSLLNR